MFHAFVNTIKTFDWAPRQYKKKTKMAYWKTQLNLKCQNRKPNFSLLKKIALQFTWSEIRLLQAHQYSLYEIITTLYSIRDFRSYWLKITAQTCPTLSSIGSNYERIHFDLILLRIRMRHLINEPVLILIWWCLADR